MSTEMEELKRHFSRVEEGQENLMTKINLMEDSIRTVKEAVSGNPPMGIKGLAERMADMEEKVKGYDKIYYKMIGVGMVVGFLWTALFTIAVKLFIK